MGDPINNTKNPKQVLIVDHERLGNLISKMLTQEEFMTEMANDGLKALGKLRTLNPDVIVAELSVSGGGIKLAELIGLSPKYQHIPVILMAANPTPDMIIRARNAGCSSFMAKPFRPSELKRRIDLAVSAPPVPPPKPADPVAEFVSQSTVLSEDAKPDAPPQEEPSKDNEKAEGILNRVKSIEGLPSFPATHAEILKMAKSEDASSDDIAEKLQLDPGFLATIFKLVNSSYYGFNKQVKDLSLAVTLLGLEEIANLVLAAQVFEKLGNYKDGAGLDLKAFWRHSVGTAFVARAVAKKLNAEVESAFLAGMLHDLGKIILDRYFSDYYKAVFEVLNEEDIAIAQAEQEILGITHAAIGGQLAEEWKFPKNYLNAITYHHMPRTAPRYQRLVCLVHLSDIICRQLNYGSGGDKQIPTPDETALERFSLGDRGMKILVETAQTELDNAESFLGALGN